MSRLAEITTDIMTKKKRIWSFFVDLTALVIVEKILYIAYMNFLENYLWFLESAARQKMTGQLYKMNIPLMMTLMGGYFFLCYYLAGGKTLGKTFFNLRVLTREGDPQTMSFMECFMRSLGYVTCYSFSYTWIDRIGVFPAFILMLSAFALPLINKRGVGIPDMFSQTLVVTDEQFDEVLSAIEEERQARELAQQEEQVNQLELFAG